MTETIKNEPISCFTYEVTMLVHIYARNREEADSKLDSEGGFVSRRDVDLKDMISLYDGNRESDQ